MPNWSTTGRGAGRKGVVANPRGTGLWMARNSAGREAVSATSWSARPLTHHGHRSSSPDRHPVPHHHKDGSTDPRQASDADEVVDRENCQTIAAETRRHSAHPRSRGSPARDAGARRAEPRQVPSVRLCLGRLGTDICTSGGKAFRTVVKTLSILCWPGTGFRSNMTTLHVACELVVRIIQIDPMRSYDASIPFRPHGRSGVPFEDMKV